MLDSIANNNALVVISMIFGLFGISIIGIVKYFHKLMTKNFDTSLKETTTNIPLRPVSNLSLTSGKYKELGKSGYSILMAKDLPEDNGGLQKLFILLFVFVFFIFTPLMIIKFTELYQNIAVVIILVIVLSIAFSTAMIIKDIQLFFISNFSGNIYHFNRGIVFRIKKPIIDMDAHQVEKNKWLPKLLINRKEVAKGSLVKTKEQALEFFNNDAHILANTIRGELRQTWWEWREWVKGVDSVKNKLFIKKT